MNWNNYGCNYFNLNIWCEKAMEDCACVHGNLNFDGGFMFNAISKMHLISDCRHLSIFATNKYSIKSNSAIASF